MWTNMYVAPRRIAYLVGITLCVFMITSCEVRQWMYDQARADPLADSAFFEDGRASRIPVPEAVPHERDVLFLPESVPAGLIHTDEHFNTGLINGQEAETFPFEVTQAVVERGQEKYNIFCEPCHGLSGYGEGIIGKRGGTPAANFHTDRLREIPVGHFYIVMTDGYRNMWPYKAKLTPEDRWAIAAYIRALQLSQNATIEDVPADQRGTLEGAQQ